eukprot:CAMPEP_0194726882 /NCGR_PEP_ID=MMETSP0296-20130528/32025_1 /TAXON_ID=39354 /ORGANISM="Heterosigma akashiwo, Strain CCMP2393" /LENGTH=169 /DNA_ID=CAMNT_0039632023 /DNA_START=20 /DNA_END=526 /DNA_ORIENTATION=-
MAAKYKAKIIQGNVSDEVWENLFCPPSSKEIETPEGFLLRASSVLVSSLGCESIGFLRSPDVGFNEGKPPHPWFLVGAGSITAKTFDCTMELIQKRMPDASDLECFDCPILCSKIQKSINDDTLSVHGISVMRFSSFILVLLLRNNTSEEIDSTNSSESGGGGGSDGGG